MIAIDLKSSINCRILQADRQFVRRYTPDRQCSNSPVHFVLNLKSESLVLIPNCLYQWLNLTSDGYIGNALAYTPPNKLSYWPQCWPHDVELGSRRLP